QSDRSNLAHGWLPFAADSITAVWHSDAARGPSTPSFDHLVGEREQVVGDGEPKRLGGLDVDDKVEFGWLEYWQVTWLLTLKDAADVNASLLVRVSETNPVAHQAARCGELAHLIDCWNGIAGSECPE